ncbi:hypothetical protein [Streptomyces sp. SAS_272]|uniref:hypothetical protein n=1 Tax=Streptomyces sp. SAS_272 TaxID=3412747 RepID=UPI00403C36AC
MLRARAGFAADRDQGRPALTAGSVPVKVRAVPQDRLTDDARSPARGIWRDVRFGLLR